MSNSTIAAISTPSAPGGIGIVRLSGPEAFSVADRLFSSPKGKTVQSRPTHTLTYGEIIDPACGQLVDECLISVMRAPHSYTGEDVCEINCHGGLSVCDRVLRLCLEQGAQLAQPGEFTKRAFLNGRMDLSKAEAVMDLISAESKTAAQVAAQQMKGRMGRTISRLREELVRVCADILVEVEYPEDDPPPIEAGKTYQTICKIKDKIYKEYCSYDAGRAIKEGVQTAIVGKPNVGKSSILNLLAGYEKAIVTDVAGTTRDVVEEKIRLGRVLLNVQDTAGIRRSDDKVEQLGIERSLALLQTAQLVLYVVDVSRPLDENDRAIMAQLDPKNTIVIFNKTDLQTVIQPQDITERFIHSVLLSALESSGLQTLLDLVETMYLSSATGLEQGEIVMNARQRDCLKQAYDALSTAVESLTSGLPFDLVTIDLQSAIDALGEITGETASEAVISDIFSRFCLGK